MTDAKTTDLEGDRFDTMAAEIVDRHPELWEMGVTAARLQNLQDDIAAQIRHTARSTPTYPALVEALEPLAKMGKRYIPPREDGFKSTPDNAVAKVPVKYLRAAYAAVAAAKGGSDGR
ncbi:hypothetical protein HW532_15585 [Kaustia mangrovi]|uniref:Uncharacterized protein n=1 Tax=Kaustia mangrovi TaxID=2593653 RepID=A0A7S8C624_9HYPH|nr:hypothetical protein [Kaustia mangrovi]QPC43986.1 hypothetical protein HW532_15585 [Kaustia mangrovi]